MNGTKEIKYTEVEFDNINALENELNKLDGYWLFRGQAKEPELTTTLERHCMNSNYSLKGDCKKIESNMIRQFDRVYDGDDKMTVHKDILYCLSLMRHYGAPTRLLDFTYSRNIAIYFAIESAYIDIPSKNLDSEKHQEKKLDYNKERSCSIWCINFKNLEEQVKRLYPSIAHIITSRAEDDKRNDKTFNQLYINNDYTFVNVENPLQLHLRLHLQQGAFLCPGNIEESFMNNLLSPYNQKTNDICKMNLTIKPIDLRNAFEKYYRMNMTRESLFPGLDGFAQSMQYQFWLYRKLDDWRRYK